MFRRSTLRRAVLALGLLALPACGGPKLVPAEGQLFIGGQPAAGVSVQFLPDAAKGTKGPTSYASTDEEGRFRLRTYDGKDGAVEGTHVVILADEQEERPPQGRPPKRAPRLDSRYTTPGGGLTAQVKAGTPIRLDVPGFGGR